MSTEYQIEANRGNATHSTGPRTESGRSNSARNALTLGLYTRQDYVKPDERDIYKEFCETMYSELSPATLLEESLTAEITGSTWRLRRCSAAEGELALFDGMVRPYRHDGAPESAANRQQDPMLDDQTEKTRRSIERARSSSHSTLHRSVNQLRRLQTDRLARHELLNKETLPAWMGIADYKQISAAVKRQHRGKSEGMSMAEFEAFLDGPSEPSLPEEELASICNPAEAIENTEIPKSEAAPSRPEPIQIPRNALCPCRSGEKFKRCCGKNAPPVLGTAPIRGLKAA